METYLLISPDGSTRQDPATFWLTDHPSTWCCCGVCGRQKSRRCAGWGTKLAQLINQPSQNLHNLTTHRPKARFEQWKHTFSPHPIEWLGAGHVLTEISLSNWRCCALNGRTREQPCEHPNKHNSTTKNRPKAKIKQWKHTFSTHLINWRGAGDDSTHRSLSKWRCCDLNGMIRAKLCERQNKHNSTTNRPKARFKQWKLTFSTRLIDWRGAGVDSTDRSLLKQQVRHWISFVVVGLSLVFCSCWRRQTVTSYFGSHSFGKLQGRREVGCCMLWRLVVACCDLTALNCNKAMALRIVSRSQGWDDESLVFATTFNSAHYKNKSITCLLTFCRLLVPIIYVIDQLAGLQIDDNRSKQMCCWHRIGHPAKWSTSTAPDCSFPKSNTGLVHSPCQDCWCQLFKQSVDRNLVNEVSISGIPWWQHPNQVKWCPNCLSGLWQ